MHLIARHYTREAGVRKLEQQIGTVCRKVARKIAEGQTDKVVITPEIVHEFLGGIKVRVDTEIAERTKRAGVAVGLAWTPAGGDVLFIEANRMKGKGGFNDHWSDRRCDEGEHAGGFDLGALECRVVRA